MSIVLLSAVEKTEAGICGSALRGLLGKAEHGYKTRVAWKQAWRGFAAAGSAHFFIKYLQQNENKFQFTWEGAKDLAIFSFDKTFQTQSEFYLDWAAPENMVEFPTLIVNHGSNFLFSIPAAGFGYFVANVARMPVLGNLAAFGMIASANLYSEVLLDRHIHSAIDFVDIVSGLAGGIVGIRLYHWWAGRYQARRHRLDY